jgi:hypothetical protein
VAEVMGNRALCGPSSFFKKIEGDMLPGWLAMTTQSERDRIREKRFGLASVGGRTRGRPCSCSLL